MTGLFDIFLFLKFLKQNTRRLSAPGVVIMRFGMILYARHNRQDMGSRPKSLLPAANW